MTATGGPLTRAPRTLREDQKVLTRQKLLAAAQDVFAAKGYARATVEDIVERAGASRGTYYGYFKNKGELATALAQVYEADLLDWIGRLERTDVSADGELEQWLQEYVDLVGRHRLTIRAWLQATNSEHQLRQAGHEREQAILRAVAAWIARNRKANGHREPARASLTRAMLLVTQLEHFTSSWKIRDWKPQPGIALASLVGSWRTAVQP